MRRVVQGSDDPNWHLMPLTLCQALPLLLCSFLTLLTVTAKGPEEAGTTKTFTFQGGRVREDLLKVTRGGVRLEILQNLCFFPQTPEQAWKPVEGGKIFNWWEAGAMSFFKYHHLVGLCLM